MKMERTLNFGYLIQLAHDYHSFWIWLQMIDTAKSKKKVLLFQQNWIRNEISFTFTHLFFASIENGSIDESTQKKTFWEQEIISFVICHLFDRLFRFSVFKIGLLSIDFLLGLTQCDDKRITNIAQNRKQQKQTHIIKNVEKKEKLQENNSICNFLSFYLLYHFNNIFLSCSFIVIVSIPSVFVEIEIKVLVFLYWLWSPFSFAFFSFHKQKTKRNETKPFTKKIEEIYFFCQNESSKNWKFKSQ